MNKEIKTSAIDCGDAMDLFDYNSASSRLYLKWIMIELP